MKVICDIECDSLSPTKIHLILCKDVDNGQVYTFRPGSNPEDRQNFLAFAENVSTWVGHNFIGYDASALAQICGCAIPLSSIVDTLVVSRLLDADRDKGHSLEAWGGYFGIKKTGLGITDWSQLTEEMEARCRSDIEINYKLYQHLSKYLISPRWQSAIATEHFTADFCRTLHDNGFSFDYPGARGLLGQIRKELEGLDEELVTAFPPRTKLVREYIPRATKHGTISKTSIPRGSPDLTAFSVGYPFSVFEWVPFNPGSPPQIVTRLNEAGWSPTEKTKGHKEAEKALRELNRKRRKGPQDHEEITRLRSRLGEYEAMGWSISEENLKTLPDTAPKAARTLARRLMVSNRASTLETWLKAYNPETGRIHGSFNHIGAWTGRMSHDKPNMGNIPKFDTKQPHKTPYSDKMRSLWVSSPGRLLIGVDAESIQLRIFGHYIKDEEFIKAIVEGKKEDGTDPHSVNQRALGAPCKSRDDAKTFIYAWLLGAGVGKIAQILGCSKEEAEEAGENFLRRYTGLKFLKEEVIPYDAERGYFEGFDGRFVRIFGGTVDLRRHLCLAGYLQSGESVIMKKAAQIWKPKLAAEKVPFWPVNFVHDEWQTETVRDIEVATYVAETQAAAIRQVGLDLALGCPFAGSILNAHGKLAIGDNWMETH